MVFLDLTNLISFYEEHLLCSYSLINFLLTKGLNSLRVSKVFLQLIRVKGRVGKNGQFPSSFDKCDQKPSQNSCVKSHIKRNQCIGRKDMAENPWW
jgi:hypothetical protein